MEPIADNQLFILFLREREKLQRLVNCEREDEQQNIGTIIYKVNNGEETGIEYEYDE